MLHNYVKQQQGKIFLFYIYFFYRENTIITQMELEKKMHDYNKDINQLKNKSILKKSLEERRTIYKK